MTEHDRYFRRDLLVLIASAELYDEAPPGIPPGIQEIARRSGFDAEDVVRALDNLEPSHLEVNWLNKYNALGKVTGITPLGLQAARFWPSPESVADRLLTAINEALDQVEEPEQRSRLVAVRDAVGGLARDLVINIGANLVAGNIPI